MMSSSKTHLNLVNRVESRTIYRRPSTAVLEMLGKDELESPLEERRLAIVPVWNSCGPSTTLHPQNLGFVLPLSENNR